MKKKLTEQELNCIIKKAVKKILKETIETPPIPDITSIPIEDLIEGYKDFRLVPAPIMRERVIYNPYPIKEAIGDVAPPDEIVNSITQKYGIPQSLVRKVEYCDKIYIYTAVALIGVNDSLIIKDMEKMGYFLSAKGEKQQVQDMEYQMLQFEPSTQVLDDITEELKNKYTTLYHWTPSYLLPQIMKDGLIPQHRNSKYNFPPRVYLIEPDISEHNLNALGQNLYVEDDDTQNTGEYTLLNIDIRNLDENIRFYHDPMSYMGVFTETAIPPTKLSVNLTRQFFKRKRPTA